MNCFVCLRLEFGSTKGNTWGAGGVRVLPAPWAGLDTNSRCQAFSSVSRPRNLEGPVPGPGTGRIGSSAALRTAARVGLTGGIERCSPDGVPEGHRCGAGAVDAFAPAGCPAHRSAGALHQEPNPRRGLPIPGASRLSGGRLEKQHGTPDFLTHRSTWRSGPPASQPSSCGWKRQQAPAASPRLRCGYRTSAAAPQVPHAPAFRRQRRRAGRSTLQPNPPWPGGLPRSRCPGCVPSISPA